MPSCNWFHLVYCRISGGKRKWQRAVQTSDQSQSSQQVCGIDTFQDGKSPDFQESPTARGLHDEARLERCLLHNPSPPQTPTLPPVHFSRQVARVPLPSIRALVSPTSVHKNVETSGSSPSFSRSSCGVLFGRHSTPAPEQRRTMEVISSGAGLTPEPGLHGETGEVFSLSNTATHIPRWPSQLGDDDPIVTSGETMCNYNDCQGSSANSRNFTPNIIYPIGTDEPCIPNWPLDSPTALPKSATRPHQNTALIQQPLTIDEDSTLSIKLGRTSLVGVSQHPELQWPAIANIPNQDDCLNRCILTGLGSNLARDNNRWSMAPRGNTGTYQSSGTESSISGAISLIQVVHSSTTTRSSTAMAYVNKRGGKHGHTRCR